MLSGVVSTLMKLDHSDRLLRAVILSETESRIAG